MKLNMTSHLPQKGDLTYPLGYATGVKNKPPNSFLVSLGKALNGIAFTFE